MKRTLSHLTRGLLALMLVVPLVALAACQTEPSTAENKMPSGGVAGTPEIEITRPRQGETLNTANVTVTVDVSDFELVEPGGQANASGQGHIIYYLDAQPPGTTGQPATAGGTYVATANTSYTWRNLTSGNHKFSVQLVNTGNAPLSPPVTDNVTVAINVTTNQTASIWPTALENAPIALPAAKDTLSSTDVAGTAAPGASSTDDPHAG